MQIIRNNNHKLPLLIITAESILAQALSLTQWADQTHHSHTEECAITCPCFGPRGLIGNGRRSRKIHVAAHFLHHRAIPITLTNALSCPSDIIFLPQLGQCGDINLHQTSLIALFLWQKRRTCTRVVGKHTTLALDAQMNTGKKTEGSSC